MRVKPIFEQVLLIRDKAEDQTDGGIFIPEQAKENTQSAVVLATGDGKITLNGDILPMPFNEGDRVLIGKFAGTPIKYDGMPEGAEVIVVHVDDIIGIFYDESV